MGTFAVLKKAFLKNVSIVLIGHTNINSIRSKFDMLTSTKKDYIDILIFSETKLDSSFTNAQFVIDMPLHLYMIENFMVVELFYS